MRVPIQIVASAFRESASASQVSLDLLVLACSVRTAAAAKDYVIL